MVQNTLLLVDDDTRVLQALTRVFQPEPYAIITASSASSAQALLEERRVSVMVTDYLMPGMTGIELISHVRQSHPEVLSILMTAHGDYQLAKGLMNEGHAYKYIEKPWSDAELLEVVREAMTTFGFHEANRALQRQLVARNNELERLTSGLEAAVSNLRQDLRSALERCRESEQLAEVGRAAAQITHDLKSPLTTLSLGVGLIKRRNKTTDAGGTLSLMEQALEQLGAMLESVPMTVRQMSAELRIENVDLDGFLRQTIQMATVLAQDKGIELRLRSETGAHVRIDAVQMAVVLGNLVKNALEAVESGFVEIMASCDPDGATIKVEDSGPGIAAEILDRLFKPFVSYGKVNGTGLGLAGAKSTVERHGGTIHAMNTGHGACFSICLPPESVVAPPKRVAGHG